MKFAPYETFEQYRRKVELMDKPNKTLAEFLELKELTRVAISHLEVKGLKQ